MGRAHWKIGLAFAGVLPAVALRLAHAEVHPVLAIGAYGGGIVAASFMLAWAAEVAQVDVSASLATALLALIAVLPEYAVDLYFAFTAGRRPEYGAFAAANMTGSNRLLIGLGWPLVGLLFAFAARRAAAARGSRSSRSSWREIERDAGAAVLLRPRQRVELGVLTLASVYAFAIPLKGTLSLVDAGALLALFGAYVWRVAREGAEEPELHGVAASIAGLPTRARRLTVGALFAVAAAVIVLAARPFAESLVQGGRGLGVDEFLLVQWLAPLASEAPELVVASVLALRREGDAALGTLLSSKVNQWTLLVGSIPIAYAAGGGAGALVLDPRQTEEFLLTAAQSVFGLSLLLGLRFGRREGMLLLASFLVQPFFPQREVRLAFAAAYLVAAVVMVFVQRKQVVPVLGALVGRPAAVG